MIFIKTIDEFLNELNESKDLDLNKLIEIAKNFDDPFKFDEYLNRNKFGHSREFSFLGERFRRLNRGTRLNGQNKIEIFRAGDEQIKWGDYVYLEISDAKRAYNNGQGNKIFKKSVPISDIIETSVDGEYYYSPKKIAKIGNDLIDFWYYVNGNNTKQNDSKLDDPKLDDQKSNKKLFKSELLKLKGKYDNFSEYETVAFNLSLKYNVPFANYEQYFENKNSDFIEINGKKYSTKNSINEYISNDYDSIVNFYKWFGDSKTIDSMNRPIVYYHISPNDFTIFNSSRFGKMGAGIYFTSIFNDLKIHNKYDNCKIYKCYLKIENLLEIENPFSKRDYDNDGIIAFKGKSGEEVKVYNSNQIKSINNDGSFNVNDDNIYS